MNYTLIPSETGDGGSSGGSEEDDGSSDELFEPCVRWLIMQGSCSTSSLQRKFKIGYTRAARLVEIMEARGIVGSQDGIKPRDILLRPRKCGRVLRGRGSGRPGTRLMDWSHIGQLAVSILFCIWGGSEAYAAIQQGNRGKFWRKTAFSLGWLLCLSERR